MATGEAQQTKIDEAMEQASRALVERRYFDAERLAREALLKAYAARDYERMARILMPLQEARRQKRDLAIDSGVVCVVDRELPEGRALQPGCYLVCPPRVGVEGRALREAADRKKAPVVVVVREPLTRDGLWPVVAVGPVTVRTKVKPPAKAAHKGSKGSRGKSGTKRPRKDGNVKPPADPLPTAEWFLEANEALGDAAIASIPPDAPPSTRVDALMERIEALPDHEKLHQRLEEAARQAAREPVKPPRLKAAFEDDEEDW